MKQLKNKVFLARGRRSVVYTAKLGNRVVTVKEKRADSKAVGRMENEAFWLKRLNKMGIGPKFRFSGEGYLVRDLVQGEFILDWIPKRSVKDIKHVLLEVLKQCRAMDRMKVNKEEMHHPVKHILVHRKKVVMIDFERCHKAGNPKNVRQFCQFLMSVSPMLHQKGIEVDRKELIHALQEYKGNNSDMNFRRILRTLNL